MLIANRTKAFLTLLAAAAFFFSCGETEETMSAQEYADSIAQWDSKRLERLKAPGGWLNLAGLFWLEEGENTLGSDEDSDHVFPRGPENIGKMIFENDTVEFVAEPGVTIKSEDGQVERKMLVSDAGGRATRLEVDSMEFFLIRRGERTGIRLRDFLHPRLGKLDSIDRYPADMDWIIEARFIEDTEGKTIEIPDVLGDVSEETVAGTLKFEYQGETHRLYPTGSSESLFLIFGDETSGLETYGGGRFLSVGGPDEDGKVEIDFNKAYNPPCAFSDYATCPLAPRENILPFEVTAGEKSVSFD